MHAAVLSNVDTIPRIQYFINTFPLKNVCFSSFLWVLIDFRAKRIILQLNPPSSEQYFGWFSYLPKGAKNLVINLYPIKYPMIFNSMIGLLPNDIPFVSIPSYFIHESHQMKYIIISYYISLLYIPFFSSIHIYIYPHHGNLAFSAGLPENIIPDVPCMEYLPSCTHKSRKCIQVSCTVLNPN